MSPRYQSTGGLTGGGSRWQLSAGDSCCRAPQRAVRASRATTAAIRHQLLSARVMTTWPSVMASSPVVAGGVVPTGVVWCCPCDDRHVTSPAFCAVGIYILRTLAGTELFNAGFLGVRRTGDAPTVAASSHTSGGGAVFTRTMSRTGAKTAGWSRSEMPSPSARGRKRTYSAQRRPPSVLARATQERRPGNADQDAAAGRN